MNDSLARVLHKTITLRFCQLFVDSFKIRLYFTYRNNFERVQIMITLNEETLTDENDRLLGWIADDGRFYPCGAALTLEQMKVITNMMESKE